MNQLIKKKRESDFQILSPESGRRGSNPRPSAWKANALSTELLPHVSTGIASQIDDQAFAILVVELS